MQSLRIHPRSRRRPPPRTRPNQLGRIPKHKIKVEGTRPIRLQRDGVRQVLREAQQTRIIVVVDRLVRAEVPAPEQAHPIPCFADSRTVRYCPAEEEGFCVLEGARGWGVECDPASDGLAGAEWTATLIVE